MEIGKESPLPRQLSGALSQSGKHLRWCRHAAAGKTDHPVRPNQVNRALYNQAAGAVLLRHFPAFINQERKRKLKFLSEVDVAAGALRIHAEYQDAPPLDRFPPVPKFAELPGAAGRVIPRIENQDDAIAPQLRKADSIAGIIA